MKIYNGNFSANALRVRAVALELGLDAEIVEINVMGGENKSDDYRAINPNGKVPALEDEGLILWESRAITSYLAGKRPDAGLYPDDIVTRALADQWSYWQALQLAPAFSKVTMERFIKPKFGWGTPDEAQLEAALKEVALLLPVLEAGLGGKDWVAGPLTVADFTLASTFVLREQSGFSLDDFPGIAAWIARVESRDSWKEAVAPMLAIMA